MDNLWRTSLVPPLPHHLQDHTGEIRPLELMVPMAAPAVLTGDISNPWEVEQASWIKTFILSVTCLPLRMQDSGPPILKRRSFTTATTLTPIVHLPRNRPLPSLMIGLQYRGVWGVLPLLDQGGISHPSKMK